MYGTLFGSCLANVISIYVIVMLMLCQFYVMFMFFYVILCYFMSELCWTYVEIRLASIFEPSAENTKYARNNVLEPEQLKYGPLGTNRPQDVCLACPLPLLCLYSFTQTRFSTMKNCQISAPGASFDPLSGPKWWASNGEAGFDHQRVRNVAPAAGKKARKGSTSQLLDPILRQS